MHSNSYDHLQAVNLSLKNIRKEIEQLASVFELDANESATMASSELSREEILKRTLVETIEILEESRKSFKSKRLEALRKKLTQVLIDIN